MTLRVRIRDTVTAALEVRRALDTHPEVPVAVRKIALESGLPEHVVREHLDSAVLDVLDVLGTAYVREMGEAIGRVERMRQTVHAFYERVLTGAESSPDPAALRSSFARLQEAVHDLVSPEEWARRKAEQRAADPMAGTEAMDLGSRPPQPAPAAPATPSPRWAAAREVRRVAALPRRLQRALARARELHPDLVAAAIRGEAGAADRLRGQLRKSGISPRDADAAATAAAAVGTPDPAYALGGRTGGERAAAVASQQAFAELPPAQRDVVRRAADADPEFVRSMVTAEITYGDPRGEKVPWRPEEMDRFCADHGIQGESRANLEAALKRLNDEHRRSLREVPAGGVGATPQARERAALLDEAAAGLGLPSSGKIAAELAKSKYLREIAAASPEHLLDLASMWLEHAEKQVAAGKPVPSLRDYVFRLMRTQVRGLLGEFTAVFALGKDFWVLKAPDLRVTDPGTDFVVVAKRNGEIWFCDNKALSDAGLSRVTSLVDNIAQNMADDLAEFGPAINRARVPVPTEIADAVAHARTAASEINQLVGQLSPADRAGPEIQAAITAICDRNGVRRVVTNAGGELTTLSAALTEFGIDLANLQQAVPVGPARPLGAGAGSTGSTGSATGGTGGTP